MPTTKRIKLSYREAAVGGEVKTVLMKVRVPSRIASLAGDRVALAGGLGGIGGVVREGAPRPTDGAPGRLPR